MNGKFITSADVNREQLDWGELGWICHPPMTGATEITVMEVTLKPGGGHNFHKHPDQEETIYVMTGQIEQWLEQNRKMLRPGDSIFIDANIVHASFNAGSTPAKLLVVLGPCVGDVGYEAVDMSGEAPWNALR